MAISSAGGHWVQLMRLREAWNDLPVVYVSVHRELAREVGAPFYYVPDANRWNKLRLVALVISVVWLVLRIKPQVIVTTGAAPGLLALVVGKLYGAKTIWIDSIANAEQLSMSGRIAKRFADSWLTQWAEVATPDGPYYQGSVV